MNMRLPTITPIDGGLFAVPGLRGAARATGVKPSGSLDLALIVAERPLTAAGMFTENATAAAPVTLCRRVLSEHDCVRTVVINSGNANALTGPKGDEHATAMALAADSHCGGPSLVLSTGVIGVPLPIDNVLAGIEAAADELTDDPGDAVARAILTTDTSTKTHAVRVEHGDFEFTVGGLAKGSGMIHPKMATMLAVVATDAPLDRAAADAVLREAVDHSFHQISVDGDTSTNDAVLLLAPPADGPVDDDLRAAVAKAVTQVAQVLAEKIIEDGEGMTRIMEIEVSGAETTDAARRIAEAIACSSLVKTALAGADPNWGRILAAAGNAGVAVDPNTMTLRLGGQLVFEHGRRLDADDAALDQHFGGDRVTVHLDLGNGSGRGRMLTTDLTRRYVEINSEYTT